MIEVSRARSGHLVPVVDGKPLNSRYDPVDEAKRFIARSVGPSAPDTIIVVGETFGYLSAEARRSFPNARVVSVFLSAELRAFAVVDLPEPKFPDQPDFFSSIAAVLTEATVERSVIVPWEPSLARWPSTAAGVLSYLRDAMLIASGNLTTTAAFGRRWLANLVHNVNSLPPWLGTYTPSRPILIAASGPSLEGVLRSLGAVLERFDVWAVPSSVPALLARSIVPKLIVSTDPGFYASMHYRSFAHTPSSLIAAPLTAQPGFCRGSDEIILLDQDTCIEAALYRALPLRRTAVPANGTVAGTALDFALSFDAPVFFVGLDFSVTGALAHARPHPFHDYYLRSASRLAPTESALFGRLLELYPDSTDASHRTSMPLRTYARWFARRLSRTSHPPVYRISPSRVEVSGTVAIEPDGVATRLDAIGFPTGRPDSGRRATPSLRARRIALFGLLSRWIAGLDGVVDNPSSVPPDIESLLCLLDAARFSVVAGASGTGRMPLRGADARTREEIVAESAHDVLGFLTNELRKVSGDSNSKCDAGSIARCPVF